MPAKYDFREGILLDKVVYKNNSNNCVHNLLYVVCLLITWAWGICWFALFFYAYLFHEWATMWVFIACWLALAVVVIVIGFYTIERSKIAKEKKRQLKEEKLREEKEIAKAKRERNMYEREQKKTDLIDNNLDPAQIKIGIESSSNRNLITSGK